MSELLSKPRILIVDDDEKSRIAVRSVLDDLDIEVVESGSGEQALLKVLHNDFALIILDVRLTGMSGFETARIIREREASREIPIIFLTGYEKEELQVNRGYDLGAVDYMLKPIIPDSLRAKVAFSVKYHRQLLVALEKERLAKERLKQLVAELERSNSDLDDFAYIASHDLKEPLRGIAINTDFLLRGTDPKETSARLQRIASLSRRMEKLISDLLYFSRLGRSDEQSENVDAKLIVDGICSEIGELINERNGQIIFETDLPMISADPSKVKTVFQNIIVNALKYNDSERPTVHIGFSDATKSARANPENTFYIRDNGIGISKKNEGKIFRIFSRLNREADYGSGTGAGLSFVKKIVESYDGKITVSSTRDRGTTFHFTFPLTDQPEKNQPSQGAGK